MAKVSEPVVVDASVLYEYVAPGPAVDTVAPMFRAQTHCWIPDHCLVEVANAMRKGRRPAGGTELADIDRAMEDVIGLHPRIVGAAELIRPAIRYMDALTSYDAVYVALAEAGGAPLCTLDRPQADVAATAGLEVLVPGTEEFVSWIDGHG